MQGYTFDKVFVSQECATDGVTIRVLDNLKGVDVSYVRDYRQAREFVLKNYADPLAGGKRVIYLKRNEGEKIKRCPGTKGKLCCGYYVINMQQNCPIDCSYCILQGYLTNPFITIFTNLDDYMRDIEEFLTGRATAYFRVGTGELTDSLALDYVTGYSLDLIDLFARHGNAILELKTKSDCVDNLLKVDPPDNVVISWSMNPETTIQSEEKGSASLRERIEAALKCGKAGYKLAFHLDPVIISDDYKEQYGDLLAELGSRLKGARIEWISMGCLRFEPPLKPVIMERFLNSKIHHGEFTLGTDNKLRYVRNVRVEAYKFLNSLLKSSFPYAHSYLCMESPIIWERCGFI